MQINSRVREDTVDQREDDMGKDEADMRAAMCRDSSRRRGAGDRHDAAQDRAREGGGVDGVPLRGEPTSYKMVSRTWLLRLCPLDRKQLEWALWLLWRGAPERSPTAVDGTLTRDDRLCSHAFQTVFQRKQTRHAVLLQWLAASLAAARPRARVERAQLRQAVSA